MHRSETFDAARRGLRSALTTLVLTAGAALTSAAHAGDQPTGFYTEQVGSGWDQVAGMTFADDGRLIVWERAGRVWVVIDGVKQSPPLLDISEEVGAWRDHGLLGLALDPNFLTNGHLYLMYVVDRHHLMHFGTGSYSAAQNEYFAASIGRITRYTAESANNFLTVDPASRLVLLGEDATTGYPIAHQSHGVGSLQFGTDGSLLATTGDSASYWEVDTGGQVLDGYVNQALSDGILKPKEDVGAFRSQLVDCLCGKVLRLDPATGDGLPSNPYFDPAEPRAARSRVFALGLRNPFRMKLRPDTGSHDPDDADPGVLFIGDVGWSDWEELNVMTAAEQNFGWPIREGFSSTGYTNLQTPNQDAPNPLYPATCPGMEFLPFQALLIEDTLDPAPEWPNPCAPGATIPPSVHRFVHRRPILDWGRPNGPARAGDFNGQGDPITVNVGAPGSPVDGAQFGGTCSVGGDFLNGGAYPPPYDNVYVQGDFGGNWIRFFELDGDEDHVHAVHPFLENIIGLVAVAVSPTTGELHYAQFYFGGPRVLKYEATGNQPPTAHIASDVRWGDTPLHVQFDGTASTDPEKSALSYLWDFGDGSPPSSAPAPSHTFTAPAGVPTRFDVQLTVTDAGGVSDSIDFPVWVNNSPPSITITSLDDGDLYSIEAPMVFALEADITDAEHTIEELACGWQTTLHHNEHTHPEPIDPACSSSMETSPIGCGENTYFFEVALTVTDPLGLAATETAFLYPDCDGVLQCPADLNDNGSVDFADLTSILAAWGACPDCAADLDDDGMVGLSDLLVVLAAWGECP